MRRFAWDFSDTLLQMVQRNVHAAIDMFGHALARIHNIYQQRPTTLGFCLAVGFDQVDHAENGNPHYVLTEVKKTEERRNKPSPGSSRELQRQPRVCSK